MNDSDDESHDSCDMLENNSNPYKNLKKISIANFSV